MKMILSLAFALFFFGCSDDAQSSNAKEEKVVEEVKKTIAAVVPKAQDVSADIAQVVEEEKSKALPSDTGTPNEGEKIFAKCAGCHGARGEKQALGKSQVITGWEESKTMAALRGYKDGSYGATMKTIMKSQVSTLSDAEIADVAKYISGL